MTPTLSIRGLLLAGLSLLAGCDQQPSYNVELDQPDKPLRVVTFAPALTQMVLDMGKAQSLVGVAQNDAAAPKGLPVVGNYTDIDTETLLSLQPTHVVMMVGKEGVPARLQDLSRTHDFQVVAYPYPQTILDVFQIVFNEYNFALEDADASLPSLASVLDAFDEGRNLKYTSVARLANLTRAVTGEGRDLPAVLLVIDTDPLMVSGVGTVHDELLGALGALNAAWGLTGSAPTLDKETLLRIRPQVILLLLPNDPPLTGIETDPRLASFRDMDIPAVRDNRILLINDPLSQLPSSSIVRVGAVMAKAIHPDRVPEIDHVMTSDPLAEDPALGPASESPQTPEAPAPDPALVQP